MSDLFAIPAETKEMLEAVLFAAGHPVSYTKLAQILEVSADEAKNLVLDFAAEYNDGKVTRGIQLLTFDDCCQLCTKPDYIGEIRTALGIRRGGNLSNSSLEVLAIVAYNQPVTRAYIDTVRGVDSSYAVNSLIERGLIEPKPRLDAPGRRLLSTTTTAFLRCFGLDSLDDLPTLSEGDAPLPNSLKAAGGEIAAEIAEEAADAVGD